MSRRMLILSVLSLLIVVSAALVWWGQRPPSIPTPIATIELPRGPANMIFDPRDGTAYVAYSTSDLSIVQDTTHKKFIDAGGTHFGAELAFDAQRNRLFFGKGGKKEIVVIENGDIATTIPLTDTGDIRDVAFDPHNGWLYVVTGGKRIEGVSYPPRITIFDEALEILHVLEDRGGFKQIVIDEVNHYVYVLLSQTEFDYVWVLKGTEKIAEYPFRNHPIMVLDPRTGDVYVLACGISEYDLTLLRQGEIVTQADNLHEACTNLTAQVNPRTGDLYALYFDAEVMVVRNDDDVLTVAGTARAGNGAAKMAIDPLTGNVYVANYGGHNVSVIQGTETVATIKVGGYPLGIGVNPSNGWVYVSNTRGSSLSVLGFE